MVSVEEATAALVRAEDRVDRLEDSETLLSRAAGSLRGDLKTRALDLLRDLRKAIEQAEENSQAAVDALNCARSAEKNRPAPVPRCGAEGPRPTPGSPVLVCKRDLGHDSLHAEADLSGLRTWPNNRPAGGGA